ncbi:MAG: tetratricopeptide repeat protein [Chloroflexaceae bacterium]|nr:tetratricopeptide repeat protein [Chloroflexaceae bacterium]
MSNAFDTTYAEIGLVDTTNVEIGLVESPIKPSNQEPGPAKALPVDRDQSADCTWRGYAAFEMGNVEMARQLFEQAVQIDPRNQTARHLVSLCLNGNHGQKQRTEALRNEIRRDVDTIVQERHLEALKTRSYDRDVYDAIHTQVWSLVKESACLPLDLELRDMSYAELHALKQYIQSYQWSNKAQVVGVARVSSL